MSMPNPQYDQILGLLLQHTLSFGDVHETTRYFFHDKELDCLGVYDNGEIAVFGEWMGLDELKPKVSVERIKLCLYAFLVRSATTDEQVATGTSRAIMQLEIERAAYADELGYAERIIFGPKQNIGFYNPIV